MLEIHDWQRSICVISFVALLLLRLDLLLDFFFERRVLGHLLLLVYLDAVRHFSEKTIVWDGIAISSHLKVKRGHVVLVFTQKLALNLASPVRLEQLLER